MDLRTYLRHLDYLLLAAAAGLLVYGVAMIYFATRHDPLTSPLYYARYQVAYAAVGVVAPGVLGVKAVMVGFEALLLGASAVVLGRRPSR